MTTTVVVTFNSIPSDDEIALMGDWLTPYLDNGNTSGFPLPMIGNKLHREWDTVENAEVYIVKVLEIYITASSAVISE